MGVINANFVSFWWQGLESLGYGQYGWGKRERESWCGPVGPEYGQQQLITHRVIGTELVGAPPSGCYQHCATHTSHSHAGTGRAQGSTACPSKCTLKLLLLLSIYLFYAFLFYFLLSWDVICCIYNWLYAFF